MRAISTALRMHRARRSLSMAATMLTLGAVLAACSGSTGPAGPAGPAGATGAAGPQGPGAPIQALDVSTATAITGKITGVTIHSPPVVSFSLTDQNGGPLKGLPASDISFVIAKLTPDTNGGSSHWTSYIYTTATPSGCPAGVVSCATAAATQATTESGSKGTLKDNGDGTYTYTFAKDITTDPLVSYDATLTHRVAFEIRGLAQANNAAYTFQPSSGNTTGLFTREIVETATCDGCHTSLSAHGGARVEVQYCVMCHSPQTTDPYSGNTVDFKQMIHKIHSGNTLPSIQTTNGPNVTPTLGQGFWIVGYQKSLTNFNTVLYPQDTRNCQTCHVQGVAATPDAANYTNYPTAEACGACHDNVNFTTGANHSTNIVATDAQCTTCHGPTSNIDNGQLQVVAAHQIPDEVAATKFQFVINSVTFTTNAGKTYPVVNFKVVNPTNNNSAYNILTDPAFTGTDPGTGKPVCASGGAARLAIDVAWETSDYTNWGSGVTASAWGQPISLNPLAVAGCAAAVPPTAITGPDATGSFTLTSPTALPTPPAANCPPAGAAACAAIANLAIVMEGHPGVVTTGPAADRIPVTSVVAYANVAGGAPVARRTVVEIAKCDVCHHRLELHGNNRNDNPQVCVACHNPASTDVSQRQTLTMPGIDGLWEQAIDYKYLIHSIHAGSTRATTAPFVIYGFGGSATNFSDVVFPGLLNRCDMCHAPGTFYPVNGNGITVQATTFTTGLSKQVPNPTTVGNPIATSANMTVCSACHVTALEADHMQQNGGWTSVMKDAEGRAIPSSNPNNVETCAICHGPGGVADVAVKHQVPASGT